MAEFTVFCREEGYGEGYWNSGGRCPTTLPELIEFITSEYRAIRVSPFAWAPQHVSKDDWARVRDESLQAGRRVRFEGGRYIAVGNRG